MNPNICREYLVGVSETTGRGEEGEEVVPGSSCSAGAWEGLRLLPRDPGSAGALWAEARRDLRHVLAGSLSRLFEGQTERKGGQELKEPFLQLLEELLEATSLILRHHYVTCSLSSPH